jgi:hypothetical protein
VVAAQVRFWPEAARHSAFDTVCNWGNSGRAGDSRMPESDPFQTSSRSLRNCEEAHALICCSTRLSLRIGSIVLSH